MDAVLLFLVIMALAGWVLTEHYYTESENLAAAERVSDIELYEFWVIDETP